MLKEFHLITVRQAAARSISVYFGGPVRIAAPCKAERFCVQWMDATGAHGKPHQAQAKGQERLGCPALLPRTQVIQQDARGWSPKSGLRISHGLELRVIGRVPVAGSCCVGWEAARRNTRKAGCSPVVEHKLDQGGLGLPQYWCCQAEDALMGAQPPHLS